MADAIAEHAPAKVNLALHVTGQRADGYHLLDSLVVFTTAGDRITVVDADQDVFSITGRFAGGLDPAGDNLVTRARDLFRDLSGISRPVAITLEKNLPIASGIGGGSSDAAATFRALGKLWGFALPADILSDAALSLGADVPMCLAAEPLIARGIGEDITFIRDLPSLAMVLVNPGVGVSTPAVFRALASKTNPPLGKLPQSADVSTLSAWLAAETRNDLEPPARAQTPLIDEVLSALKSRRASLARMSGSGATCFGLFADADAAREAASALAALHPSWYVEATQTL